MSVTVLKTNNYEILLEKHSAFMQIFCFSRIKVYYDVLCFNKILLHLHVNLKLVELCSLYLTPH